jgi:DNA-directed RNA polymerase specialized sigma24 family protein
MSDQGSITQWIGDLREGRATAADGLWRRYYHRLVGLARKKLRDAPRRMADEEDVVLQAFHSFCRGAEQGRFPKLEDRDDLWQILVMLTARKAADQLKLQFRDKRGGGQVRGDSVFIDRFNSEERAGIDQVVGSEPTPEFAAHVAEGCRQLMDKLDDETLRTVATAKMEGYTNEEIANRLGVQTRTVERKLRLIRELWSQEA